MSRPSRSTPEELLERKRARSREYAKRFPEKINAHVKASYNRRKHDPDFRRKVNASTNATKRRYPLARLAQHKIHNLVRQGKIPRACELLCVDCGKGATDYDHRDYTKPLEVAPTCRSCNRRRGPGYPYNQAQAVS